MHTYALGSPCPAGPPGRVRWEVGAASYRRDREAPTAAARCFCLAPCASSSPGGCRSASSVAAATGAATGGHTRTGGASVSPWWPGAGGGAASAGRRGAPRSLGRPQLRDRGGLGAPGKVPGGRGPRTATLRVAATGHTGRNPPGRPSSDRAPAAAAGAARRPEGQEASGSRGRASRGVCVERGPARPRGTPGALPPLRARRRDGGSGSGSPARRSCAGLQMSL